MSQLQPPSTLSLQGNLAEKWRTWIQKFELFCSASGVAEQTQKVQCATFLHVAGEEAMQVWNTFVFHDDEKDKIEVLKKKFQDYCEPRRTLPRIRHVFFTRAQGPTETIDDYVTDLKNKASGCEFGQLRDSLIRDRIVCGIRDDEVRLRLLKDADLTLGKAIDICRGSETTSSQVKVLNGEIDVHKGITDTNQTQLLPNNQQKDINCKRCVHKHAERKCPGPGQTWKLKHKRNHFAKTCKTQGDARKTHAAGQDDGSKNVNFDKVLAAQPMGGDEPTSAPGPAPPPQPVQPRPLMHFRRVSNSNMCTVPVDNHPNVFMT